MSSPSEPTTRTQKAVRNLLLKHTPKRSRFVSLDGVRGKFSKVTEEYQKLENALTTGNQPLAFAESCDLVDATLRLQAKQFMAPGFVILAAVYLRRVYKPLRNRMYEYAGLDKEDFNAAEMLEPRETKWGEKLSADTRTRMERTLDASLGRPTEATPITPQRIPVASSRAKQRSQ